jgi:hypothetical protein
MDSRNQAVIDECVSDSCLSLFKDYSLPLARIDVGTLQQNAPLIFCGVVGFSGDQMRGTLLLATSREPLGRTSPTTDASLREWIAELANQLLGRIKNRLLNHGVILHLSTPIVLRGEHIAPISQTELVPYAFACDGGNVCVWFDAELPPSFDLGQRVETEGLAAEGTSMLF